MEEVSRFPERVALFDDGAYRWTYNAKSRGNTEPFNTMIRTCLIVTAPICVVMLVMLWRFDSLQALLSVLFMLALCVGLPALVWRLSPVNPSFRMSETEIEGWPQGKNRNIHTFVGVRKVRFLPDRDLIRMRWAVSGLDVYVPPEDYGLVKAFILAHVPNGVDARA